jgi:glycosyltransferase involved in cell wall biosynthesis
MPPEPVRLVVPCYDEEARFPAERFAAFAAEHPEVSFVFVDDGSRDATAGRLETLASRLGGQARVVRLPRNLGKASAVRAGVQAACTGPPSGFVGYWDADLATPLEDLELLRAALRERPEAVLALGSRVKLLGRAIERSSLRHYPGRVFATFASLVLELGVYDTQCGAKLFRDGAETRALFAEPFSVGWTFDVELLARLVAARRERGGPPVERDVIEVPLRAWSDPGDSKVRPADFLVGLWELWRLRRRYFGARLWPSG